LIKPAFLRFDGEASLTLKAKESMQNDGMAFVKGK
jgi:hypothetical protein